MLIKPYQLITTLLVCSALFISGCATPHLNINIKASESLNTDESGTSYAVLVRVYQLRDTTQFDKAAYPDLWKSDVQVLGGSLVSVREVTVEPSISQSISIKKEEGTRYAGIVAFFRSQDGEWKVHRKVNHGFIPASTEMTLQVSRKSIGLQYR